MTHYNRIGVFFSREESFGRVLLRVREAHPEAQITAIAPPDYAMSDDERALADEAMTTPLSHHAPGDLKANAQLVRAIRRRRFDLFVVMFPSTQLQILAALSGARACRWMRVTGRSLKLPSSLSLALMRAARREIVGHLRYAWIWLAVRLLHVRPEPGRRP